MEKSGLPERLLKSLMARRMMEHTTFTVLKTTDVDIDLVTAFDQLVAGGKQWIRNLQSIGSTPFLTIMHSKHLVCLLGLKCVEDSSLFITMFSKGSPHLLSSPYLYELSLQHFSDRNLNDNKIAKVIRKNIVVEALLHFEEFLRFCCGEIYENLTYALRQDLLHGVLANYVWEIDYIKYEIETAIHDTLHYIRNSRRDAFLLQFPEIDISLPTGVRSLWDHMFRSISPTESSQNSFLRESVKVTVVNNKIQQSTITTKQSGFSNNIKAVKTAMPAIQSSYCKRNFLHGLKIINKQGDLYPACKIPTCSFQHITVAGSQKSELNRVLKNLVDRPNPLIAGVLLELVKEAIRKH
jgi:hypothetical protein